jgi:hypothetical protein
MTDDALRAALAAVRDEATTPHPTVIIANCLTTR